MAVLATAEWDFTKTVSPGGNIYEVVSFAWLDKEGIPVVFPSNKYFIKQAEWSVTVNVSGGGATSGSSTKDEANWYFRFNQGFITQSDYSRTINKTGRAYNGNGEITTSIVGDYVISEKFTQYGKMDNNLDKVYIATSIQTDDVTATLRFTGKATVYPCRPRIN